MHIWFNLAHTNHPPGELCDLMCQPTEPRIVDKMYELTMGAAALSFPQLRGHLRSSADSLVQE